MNEHFGYDKFFSTIASMNNLFPSDCSVFATDLSKFSTTINQPFTTNYTLTFSNTKEKDMMTLFNWFLVSKFEEGKEPIKSGFITSVDEESAREFIVRSLDTETFIQYKDGEYALVVIEVDSWEI